MNHTRIGLVRCDHCGRQFNPHSGARHIPWCAKQQANNRRHKMSADKLEALERYKWRINYRPSNHMSSSSSNSSSNNSNRNRNRNKTSDGRQNHQPPRQLNLADFSRRQTHNNNNNDKRNSNKSSVNSSATLSSPSAGSTASTGTANSLSSNHIHSNGRQTPAIRSMLQQQQQQQLPRSQPPVSVAQLKRSVSSHTLTKQRGTIINPNRRIQADSVSVSSNQSQQNYETRQQRTKSVSDLSKNMSEIVETLAKRMEEIYAQNQILLANWSSENGTNKTGVIRIEGDESRSDTKSESQIVRCHHCKSSCAGESNYCHNCGCKLHATISPSPSSTPG